LPRRLAPRIRRRKHAGSWVFGTAKLRDKLGGP
jgi:hypothetical protein